MPLLNRRIIIFLDGTKQKITIEEKRVSLEEEKKKMIGLNDSIECQLKQAPPLAQKTMVCMEGWRGGIYCAPVSRLKDPQGFFNPTPTKTKQQWTHHNFMELGIPLPPQSPSNPQAIFYSTKSHQRFATNRQNLVPHITSYWKMKRIGWLCFCPLLWGKMKISGYGTLCGTKTCKRLDKVHLIENHQQNNRFNLREYLGFPHTVLT